MNVRQLVRLTAAASLLVFSTGCELIVDFDRSDIDSSMMQADTGMPDACTTACGDAGEDSGTDSGDNDSGTMDAMVDSGGDSGSDAMVDAAMDAADNDSGT